MRARPRWLFPAMMLWLVQACSNAETPQQDAGSELDATWSCAGCFEGAICRAGNSPAQCGQGGVACFQCEPNEVCVDGACHAPPPCGPNNCAGCCSTTGTCLEGKTIDSCGKAGVDCQVCATGECLSGGCVETCGPGNCRGCCLPDGNCRVLVAQDGRCGTGGGACAPCDNDEVCSPVLVATQTGTEPGNGTCTPSSCVACAPGCCLQIVGGGYQCEPGTGPLCGKSGQSCKQCQANETCTNQECVPGPTVVFKLVLESGVVPERDADGVKWDYLSPPDAGVTVRIATSPQTVGPLIEGTGNTTTPSFLQQTGLTTTLSNFKKGIWFDVVDVDSPDDDDPMGTVPSIAFVPPDSLFLTGAGAINLTANGIQLRFRFVRN